MNDAIGKQVRELERRQSPQNYQLALVTSVGSAILGWLALLFGTTITVLRLLGH